MLPAQNATGNWVKVVQRVPIRLAVQMPADAPPLRTGMSANVEIDTGHRRHLGDLFGRGEAVRGDVINRTAGVRRDHEPADAARSEVTTMTAPPPNPSTSPC